MYGSLFLFQIICVGSLLSASTPSTQKCKLTDTTCLNDLANSFYQKAINGHEEFGLENLVPLRQKKIEADLAVLKYTLQNTTCYGFEKCKIDNMRHSPGSKLHLELICPFFEFKGDYEIDGQLIVIPIQGKGPYVLKANDYVIKIESEMKKTTGKDGKTYIAIKKYNITPELHGRMDFFLENLFNGREDLAAPARKFIKENYKAVADLLQGPAFDENVKKIMKNFNKVLKTSPMEDYIDYSNYKCWTSSTAPKKVACALDDITCTSLTADPLFKSVIKGRPSHKVPSSDPLLQNVISGRLDDMNYNFTNAELYGLGNCNIQRHSINILELSWTLQLQCPELVLKSNYMISGAIGEKPIEGNGQCNIVHDKCRIGLRGNFLLSINPEGKPHLQVTSFDIDRVEAKNIKSQFFNLYNGDVKKSEDTHKYLNNNWKNISFFAKFPTFPSFMEKMIENINVFLQVVPTNELFYTEK